MGLFQIHIPKPCHENWDLMSKEEQGRFCSKCAKTVMDFTEKSKAEIADYFQKHQNENVCGRINSAQLKQPFELNIILPASPIRFSYKQIFILSLFIVFGTTLFSCTTHNDDVLGKIKLVDTTEIPVEQKESHNLVGAIVAKIKDQHVVETGEVCIAPIEFKDKVNPSNSPQPVVQDDSDTITFYRDLKPVDINAFRVPLMQYGSSMGLIAVTVVNQSDEVDSVEKSTVSPESGKIEVSSIANVVFPNPTNGIINVELNIENEEFITIQLFDLAGRLIQTLKESEQLNSGRQTLQFDLSDLQKNTYLLRISDEKTVETRKIILM